MDRHGIRYLFEHRLLPQWFFEDKTQFVGLLLNEKEILFNIINDLFEKENVDNPYKREDFTVMASKVTADVLMVRIGFPAPEEEPLCYCAYIFFDKAFDKVSYFCIERGNKEGDNYPFVCSWTPDGAHNNHGNCSLDSYNDFIRCADIHMEREYGLRRETGDE
ncbi:MAG: hypothetical protein K2N94_04875 [Lachnospiraceae bacterium]|nr:hypothetical protein [Lachnospiraceae bacterium]